MRRTRPSPAESARMLVLGLEARVLPQLEGSYEGQPVLEAIRELRTAVDQVLAEARWKGNRAAHEGSADANRAA